MHYSIFCDANGESLAVCTVRGVGGIACAMRDRSMRRATAPIRDPRDLLAPALRAGSRAYKIADPALRDEAGSAYAEMPGVCD